MPHASDVSCPGGYHLFICGGPDEPTSIVFAMIYHG